LIIVVYLVKRLEDANHLLAEELADGLTCHGARGKLPAGSAAPAAVDRVLPVTADNTLLSLIPMLPLTL